MSIDEWLNDPNGPGNSEAASENPPKRKRGRPRIMPRDWDEKAAHAYGQRHPRTYLKRHYAHLAKVALSKSADQDFSYLFDETGCKWDLLSELGQLHDDERIREAAIVICEYELKSKEAIPLLRRWRTGKSVPGNTTSLVNEIAKVIRYYKLSHPDMTDQQVRSALWRVCEEFGEYDEAIYENEDPSDDEVGNQEGKP